jgi:hypothetical protein
MVSKTLSYKFKQLWGYNESIKTNPFVSLSDFVLPSYNFVFNNSSAQKLQNLQFLRKEYTVPESISNVFLVRHVSLCKKAKPKRNI